MSMFSIAVSGIKASQTYLNVTANNISNANTTGFKRSRAEFADVYSTSVFTNTKTVTGLGVTTASVSQQFEQGSLSGDTGNNLDMAISGEGFFILTNVNNPADGSTYVEVADKTYTRAGAFQLDSEGYIVTAQGDYLQGWTVDDDGNVTSLDIASTHSIQIPSDTGAPQASSYASIGVNLPASADTVSPPTGVDASNWYPDVQNGCENWYIAFDPSNSDTYTCSTSQTIYDSLGGAHTLTYYFMKMSENDDNTTTWNVIVYVDGSPVDIATANNETPIRMVVADANSSVDGEVFYGFQLTFDSSGTVTDMVPSALYLSNSGNYSSPRLAGESPSPTYSTDYSLQNAMGGGVDPEQDLHIYLDATQYGSSTFSVNTSPSTDGYATGILTNVSVSEDGIIQAEYSNGRVVNVAKVALATFSNPQGLTKVGDTQWKASRSSGEATPKEANTGGAGSIKGANLEESNVDLTSSLVDLIIGQRNYQANAQSLQTQNTVMDSILNIR